MIVIHGMNGFAATDFYDATEESGAP